MNWRRAATRYGQTPAPATPYQRAEQLWDERIGAARVQAANWRLMAFGALALAAVAIGDDIRARSRSVVTPYVVEVDRTGAANAIAPAVTEYQPSDAQIGYFLARFVQNTRALPIDPIVVRQAWLDAYDQITSHAKPVLDDYARQVDPFGKSDTGRSRPKSPAWCAPRTSHSALRGSSMHTRKGPQFRRSAGRRS
jgi:type IV secretory pathway TrbF-like protein